MLMQSGQLEFELYLPGNGYVALAGQWAHAAPILEESRTPWGTWSASGPGATSAATRFRCPSCDLDKRINERVLTDGLRRFGDSAPQQIDVSLIP